jgi:concanavalin A-like lectin/glucanase superfamily protein
MNSTVRRPTIICASLVFICLMMANISDAKVDPDTIVGMWLFDEGNGDTIKDSSGNGDDGEINGAKWVEGMFGTALEFNGSTDAVACPDNDSLDITDVITVSAWIKTPQPAKNFQMIVTHGMAVWELRFNASSGTVHFCAQIAGVWIDQTKYSTDTILDADTWYHVVGTYDGSEVITWLDGKNDGHFDVSGEMPLTDLAVNMGRRVEGGGYFYSGVIDEVAIFNVALPEDDVKSLMDGLESVLAVSPLSKLATTWANIKAR